MRDPAAHLVRRRILVLIVWIAGLLWVGAPERGYAKPEAPQLSGKTAELYHAGQVLYAEGNYEAAVRKLRRAYRQNAHPMLLYNLALAQWRAGRLSEALESARLLDESSLPKVTTVKKRALVRGLEVRERVETVADRTAAATAEEAKSRSESQPAPRAEQTDEKERSRLSPRVRRERWAGGLLLGVGGLALGGTIWIDRRLAGLFEDYRRAGRRGRPAEYRRLQTRIEREQRVAVGVFAGGLAAVGVGTYLAVRNGFGGGDRAESITGVARERPGLVPVPAIGIDPDFIGLVLTLRARPAR